MKNEIIGEHWIKKTAAMELIWYQNKILWRQTIVWSCLKTTVETRKCCKMNEVCRFWCWIIKQKTKEKKTAKATSALLQTILQIPRQAAELVKASSTKLDKLHYSHLYTKYWIACALESMSLSPVLHLLSPSLALAIMSAYQHVLLQLEWPSRSFILLPWRTNIAIQSL